MMCNSCETQYPDMCDDCMETIKMEFPEDFLYDEVPKRIYVGSGEDTILDDNVLQHMGMDF
jgi:hypothetical protein